MPPVLQRRQYQIFIDRIPEAVFAFHTNLKNQARIDPPDQPEEIIGVPIHAIGEGSRVTFRLAVGTLYAEFVEWTPPYGYALRQIEGPFTHWQHRRKFTLFQGGTLMTDQLEYGLPAGPLGLLIDKVYLGTQIDKLFNYRHAEAKRLIERIGRIKGRDAL